MTGRGGTRVRLLLVASYAAVLAAAVLWALVSGRLTFVLVYLVLVAVFIAFYTRHLRRRDDAFMWRHGVSHTETVHVPLDPATLRHVVAAELDRQGAWRLTDTPDGVDARRGMTAAAFGTRLYAQWQPSGAGQQVFVTVRLPQLFAWHTEKRIARRLTDALRRATDYGRGADDSSHETKPV